MKVKRLLAAALGSACILFGGHAVAIPVALELALLVDVSSSVSTSEFETQRDGYVAAFQNPALQALIAAQTGGIAVTYIQWSSGAQQQQSVVWTHITNAGTANAFAAAVLGAARAFSGLTGPGSAIKFAVPLFGTETGAATNGFESARQVIDVSGDGATTNSGASTPDARDAALLAGIDAINGLAIGSGVAVFNYYVGNIQGGTGSFTIAVDSFTDFPPSVAVKLRREITQVPEPGSLALLGLALAGLTFFRRRTT